MHDPIEDLQMRFAHQELAIEALHDSVLRQDRLIAELREELVRIKQQVRELRPSPLGADGADEPPPPHY
ncbi:MAG: SlyX family protein [Chromatiaceae bacterium]|jgi:SlyX protein|nr:SlyX family protein [Chromatiaceae bacterium]